MHLFFLSALFSACGPCPINTELGEDGACHQEAEKVITDSQETEDTDSGEMDSGLTDSGQTDTSDSQVSWQTLSDSCTGQSGASDPLTKISSIFVQDYIFAEMVHITMDEENNMVWGTGQGGLMVFDISDPENPNFLGGAENMTWNQRYYYVHPGPGNAVYSTHRDFGLVVHDRSNVQNMNQTANFMGSGLSGMDSAGDRLYVSAHNGSIHTYDISTPLYPQHLSQVSGLGNIWAPYVLGERIYLADNTEGVTVLDISNPDSPEITSKNPAAGGVQALAFAEDGSHLYAAAGGAGVEVFSLSDPDFPASLGTLNLHHSVISVAVDGDILWAATYEDVVAIDISNPGDPLIINSEKTEQWAMTVTAGGGKAYVGDWAYMSVFEADTASPAPDLDPASENVYLAAGGEMEVSLANLGGAELSLSGATSSSPEVRIQFSGDSIPTGEQIKLKITSVGSNPQTEICIGTNDPDEPIHRINVSDQGSFNSSVGQVAPDFTLEGLDGNYRTLSDQRGSPVVLIYFATW